jgi:hypothetical protein
MMTIVGVVADVKQHYAMEKEVYPALYVPRALPSMALVARARDNPLSLLSAVRGEVRKLDRELAGAGALIGLGGALTLKRLMETLVFGVSATDPLTFTTIALLLALVVLLACWIPARRATKVDPMIALRRE